VNATTRARITGVVLPALLRHLLVPLEVLSFAAQALMLWLLVRGVSERRWQDLDAVVERLAADWPRHLIPEQDQYRRP